MSWNQSKIPMNEWKELCLNLFSHLSFQFNSNVYVLLAVDRRGQVDEGAGNNLSGEKQEWMRAPITRKSRCQLRVAGSQSFDRSDDGFAISLLISISPRMIMANRRGQLEICYYNHVLDLELRESLPMQPRAGADFLLLQLIRSSLLFAHFHRFYSN